MEEGSGREVQNTAQTDAPEDPFSLCLRSEMTGLLTKAIDELPERERQLLALYYYEELTMKEAGAVLGIGEARVSQLHSAAIVRLRARMSELLSGQKNAEEKNEPASEQV